MVIDRDEEFYMAIVEEENDYLIKVYTHKSANLGFDNEVYALSDTIEELVTYLEQEGFAYESGGRLVKKLECKRKQYSAITMEIPLNCIECPFGHSNPVGSGIVCKFFTPTKRWPEAYNNQDCRAPFCPLKNADSWAHDGLIRERG